jgi:hypothetical protein
MTRGWNDGILAELSESRAVKVNGDFTDLEKIPETFARILMGGATANLSAEDRRTFTIAGLLVPEAPSSQLEEEENEFVKLNWNNDSVRYRVPNPLMSKYYRDSLIKKFGLTSRLREDRAVPASCADLLARALPYMSFLSVINPPALINNQNASPLSQNLLPFEDNYNSALVTALKDLGYTVAQLQGPAEGKPDLYLRYEQNSETKTMAIETIMTTRPQVGSCSLWIRCC